jgi:hypothetical protein
MTPHAECTEELQQHKYISLLSIIFTIQTSSQDTSAHHFTAIQTVSSVKNFHIHFIYSPHGRYNAYIHVTPVATVFL